MQRLREWPKELDLRPKELDLKDFTFRSGPTDLAVAIEVWDVFLCTSWQQICKQDDTLESLHFVDGGLNEETHAE